MFSYSSFTFFPCPSVHIIMFSFCLPAQHMVDFSVEYCWHTTFTPPPTFPYNYFYHSIYHWILFWFLLICSSFYFSNLLPLSLCPCLYAIIGSWCLPALHMVFLPWSRAGLRLFPSYCFVLVFQFINQILHSLSFSFLPLCSCECTPVSDKSTCLCLFCQRTSLSNVSSTTTLPSLPNASINPIGWHQATETFPQPTNQRSNWGWRCPLFYIDIPALIALLGSVTNT